MVPEAPLDRTDAGLVPAGEGWFVVNACESRWFENEDFDRDEPPTSAASSYAWTEHVLVGAGGPCIVLAVGARPTDGIVDPVSERALRHGAGVAEEAHDGKTANAQSAQSVEVRYREGRLPS